MGLTLVTAAGQEPISLAEAKLHLNEDFDDNDALIRALISAARQHVESYTRRQLITQTWDYQMDAFPCGAFIVPLAPVSAISSMSYVDTAGVTQTWSSSNYRTDLPVGERAPRPRIEPAYGVSYPSTQAVMNAVTVRCVVGYGASGASVPAPILAAMKLLIGHWFANRELVVTGTIATELPSAVASLLWPYKVF